MSTEPAVVLINAVAEVNCAGWCADFVDQLALGFRELGVETSMVVIRPGQEDKVLGELSDVARGYQQRGLRPLVIDVNGRAVSKVAWPEVDCLSLVVDHPIAHPQLKELGPSHWMGFVDRAHLRAQGYKPIRKLFAPHGGPAPAPAALPAARRDIPFLFSGNFTMPPERDVLSAALSFLSPQGRDLCLQAADVAAEAFADPCEALIDTCRQGGFDITAFPADRLAEIARHVSGYTEAVHRWRLLQGVGDLEVHVVGFIPEAYRRRLSGKFTAHGVLPFQDFVGLLSRAQCLLNCAPKFPSGSHERVFYAMAEGCLVATTPSTFLAESFKPGEAIHYYRSAQDVLDFAAGADDAAIERMVGAATEIYARRHTWKSRAARIVAAFRK